MLFQTDAPETAAFRATVRDWLEANLPAAWRGHLNCLDADILRGWQQRLHARGWVAPAWPKSAGGMGATLDEQLVLLEEQTRIGAPYLVPTGINLLGPTLIEFGTEAQKARFLPAILSGDIFWAQGYSETEAGSDLASLRTTARRVGDRFVVTGRKIWSSYAHLCQWMFALVRTDTGATPRQAGLSMLLVPLQSPGVTVRAIRTIADQDEFAEVVLDHVEVPTDHLLGPLHGGWRVANHVLVSERLSNGSPRIALLTWRRMVAAARASGRWADPAFRDRVAATEVWLIAHLAGYRTAVDEVKAGRSIDRLAPLLKISSTELVQRFNALLHEAAGPLAGGRAYATSRLLARRGSIYGGSNEIQRNIVATRVLGLPKSW